MEFDYAYGVADDFYFTIPKIDDTELAPTAAWTPAAGHVKISKDFGTLANVSSLPTAVAGTSSFLWRMWLTSAELQAEKVAIQIIVPLSLENNAFTGTAKHTHQILAKDGIEIFTVNSTDVAPTNSSWQADRGLGRTDESTADHFRDRKAMFLNSSLQGQITDCVSYTMANSRGSFTVSGVTDIPPPGSVFQLF